MSRVSTAHRDAFGQTANEISVGLESRRSPATWSDYVTLTKARIAAMVVITAAVGFALAGADGGGGAGGAAGASWSWATLIGALVGTTLSCMGAGALNQLIERHTDRKMPRTADRPIPAGRISPAEACWIGCGLSLAGVGTLLVTANALAAAISALTILSYVFIYTPMKVKTPTALFVGAIPGAAPPLIGYAAAAHTLRPAAWAVFALMFIWQIPHFLAIGWLYREDYAKAKMPMIPVIDPTGARTARHTMVSCFILLAVGLLPAYLGITGAIYLATALILGVGFTILGISFSLNPSRQRARRVFFASLIHLPVILAALVIGLMIR